MHIDVDFISFANNVSIDGLAIDPLRPKAWSSTMSYFTHVR